MIHEYIITPRYAETDMMGIIHHSVYLIWAEVARTALLLDSGHSYSQIEESGIMLPVTEIQFRYKKPTYYATPVIIKSAITTLNSRQLRVDYKVYREDILCTVGYSKHIFIDSINRNVIRISEELLEKYRKFYNIDFQNIL